MAGLNKRFMLAAILFPLLVLATSRWAQAMPPPTIISVNTTEGVSEPAPLCSLPDAIAAHNKMTAINGCVAGSGNDVILFEVTGTITIDEPLEIMSGTLIIDGPVFGCTGAGPCGVTISGGSSTQILSADAGTTVTLEVLTFANGFAGPTTPGEGGAIFANGTVLNILDSLFVNNEAEHTSPGGKGGAIFINSAGTVNIVNTTFSGNTAAGTGSVGGAITDMNTSSTLELTNVTIADNSASAGGGYASMVKPSVKGSIFDANTPQNCAVAMVTNVGTANISSDTSCGATHHEDPLLDIAGLQNNGGPTDTIALQATSPAINLIPVADCTDQEATPEPLGTDQRLFGRPDPLDLTACDSGAYEYGAVAAITLSTSPGPKIQIARSTSPMSDLVNMNFTFTDNGTGGVCDAGNDALNGLGVILFQGTCAAFRSTALFLTLDPFVKHMVGSQAYGTFYNTDSLGTVSARIVQIGLLDDAPCGEWNLNIEASGLDTATFGLTGGSGPGTTYALIIEDRDGNAGCFDITNVVAGGQVGTPGGSTGSVRRETRR
jgi:hypothetical protein